MSSFVGREREVAEVKRLLGDTRLLTLTGLGGCGKTRLAMASGFEVVEGFEDGVWWVGLASLSDPDLVPQAVAQVVGVREGPGRPLSEALAEHLVPKSMLLVLDNCEHLIDACAELVDTLLRWCPGLKILATSREALSIAGEVTWVVPSLSLPDPGRPHQAEALTRYEAIRLFEERAKAVASGFELTEENAPTVARVCRRLEGIPLAIELAAARVGVLSVEQILGRLEDSLRVLAGRDRTAPVRQRTLRGALDWSHDLLSEPERELFERLSVFAGGWTLEAAEAVGAGGGIEGSDVLDLLYHLVDKSMVVAEAGSEGAPRYKMLEPVRQYARERLGKDEKAQRVFRRHADFFLAFAERAEPRIKGADRRAWLERLETEHNNLRVALRWAAETGESETGLRLAGALWWFWFQRGYWSEGRGWLEGALAGSEASPPTAARAEASCGLGALTLLQGALTSARSRLEESAAIWREVGDQRGLAYPLTWLAVGVTYQGDFATARSLLEQSLAIFRGVEDRWGTAQALNNLGIVEEYREEYALAKPLFEESLTIFREVGDRWALSQPLRHLGSVALRQGDNDRAAALCKESLALCRSLEETWFISISLEDLAEVACIEGDYRRAARVFGAAEVLREAIGATLRPLYRAHYERNTAAARSQIGEVAWEAAWAEGKAMSLEGAIEYALSEGEPSPARKGGKDALSEREVEILRLVAGGLTDSQVAQRLYLSPRTVGQHLRSIYRKLGVPSRAAAAREAVERSLI